MNPYLASALILTAALLGAIWLDGPYAYYQVLRIFVCVGFGFAAYLLFNLNKKRMAWLPGIVSFLYNPIAAIHLDRETWEVINLVTVAIAWFLAVYLIRCQKKSSA